MANSLTQKNKLRRPERQQANGPDAAVKELEIQQKPFAELSKSCIQMYAEREDCQEEKNVENVMRKFYSVLAPISHSEH